MLFEMIGAYLQYPQVDMAQVWNTRWINASGTDLWNTLDANNGLRASGKAMAIWGQFLRSSMVQSSNTAMIRSFASFDPASGQLNVFLINKDTTARPASLAFTSYPARADGSVWQLHCTGPDDKAPAWDKVGDIAVRGGTTTLTLAPVSITVITLQSSIVATVP